MRGDNVARDARIVRMAKQGVNTCDIAEAFGLKKERVTAIVSSEEKRKGAKSVIVANCKRDIDNSAYKVRENSRQHVDALKRHGAWFGAQRGVLG